MMNNSNIVDKPKTLPGKEKKQEVNELISNSYERIYRTAFLLTGNAQDSDDAVQESCLIAIKNFKSFKAESSFNTWLCGILINIIKRKHRKLKYFSGLFKQTNSTDQFSSSDKTDRSLLEKEKHQILNNAVAKLPIKLKTVIILRHYNEMNYAEISDILKCSTGTVKSRLHYARLLLRKKMEGFYG